MILITSFKKKPKFITGISISRWQPRGFNFASLKLLAPIDRFGKRLEGFLDHNEYRKLYKAVLMERKAAVEAWLETLDRNKDIALVCWCNIEQQRLKGYETIMCHSILVGNTIKKHRPDIMVFVDWDRYRYPIWNHNLPPFDEQKYLRKTRKLI
jgi:hypothetical protein